MMRTVKICALLCLLFIPAIGEYFGRNKVQYDDFDFKVLNTNQFRIYFYPSEESATKEAGRMLERWHTRFKMIFDRTLPKRQPVLIYANHADFQQTNAISGLIPEGTGGVTEGLMNRIILPLTGIGSENNHVLGHELAHVFHYNIIKENPAGIGGAQQIPLWFIEGMSEYLSIGSYSPLTAMWMRDAVLSNDIPSFSQISRNTEYFPYRYGHAIWAYIGGTYGDHVISPLFHSTLKQGWYPGFKSVLGISIDSVSAGWQRAIREKFSSDTAGRTLPSRTGTPVIKEGSTNLSPVISPDGRYIAFLSTKDLFSIDLYLADVSTGKIIKRLVSAETDQHFDALRFMSSSGTWSPDGEQFAFIVFKDGDNAIAILDIKTRKVTRTFKLKDVDEIAHIAWSPDGKKLAISGTSGAISDLYTYDLETSTLHRLTNDKFAELQPSWSPDGKWIVFATDRGYPTNLDSLKFSPLKIGIINIEGCCIRVIRMAEWVKHINPQYSPDGNSIYFVADPDGFSDIYRYSLETNRFFRVTNTATGISGLTELSPAISVAMKSGKTVFSIYDKKGYKIHSLDSTQTEGEPFTPDKQDYLKTVKLPPMKSENSIVDDYLGKSSEGLVEENRFSIKNYNPRLGLLYVGQLYAGLSADPLGVGVGGGVSFLFSDILGDHLLGLGAQINGSLRDFGAEGFYLNMDRRLNWGLVLSRIPYASTFTEVERDTATVDGEVRDVQKVTFTDERIFDNQIGLLAAYPLSSNRRFEFQGSYTRISYDYQSEEIYALSGRVVRRNNSSLDEPTSLNLFRASAAYVGDFSNFGFTGPVTGRRYRYELEPTSGSLSFLTALADYRQYFLMNPFTLAFRFFHYGRYLRDSESDRLSPLFLGYETWVRGYSYYSYNLRNCSSSDNYADCPDFSRLIGSRVGVFNAELRLPLLGNEQFGLINFPYLPMELVAFLDGGVAWSRGEIPVPKLIHNTRERVPVFSAGAATRINLFGLLVLQIYYAYPFQRTDRGGNWGFLFAPGW